MLSQLGDAVLASDFQPKLKLKFPLQCPEATQWAYDRIHYIPPSHHMVKSSGEFIVSSMLDVAILAERGKNCDKQCHFSRSLFILALSLCLLDQREFAAYSTALDAGRDWGQEEKGTRG